MRDTTSRSKRPPRGRLPPAPPVQALLDFLRSESLGGVALIVAAAAALLWSNSPFRAAYAGLLALPLGVSAGGAGFTLRAEQVVDDALMALFFLQVALEIRRELSVGALASRARAAAPCIGALGGMVVPAALFLLLNHGDAATRRGWAVPVATDIAFALAALSVLGRRVPVGLKVFLAALAIIDDLGAIVVIALFYTADLHVEALGGAAALWCLLLALRRAGVARLWPFLAGGVVLWALVFRSGIHPTLAGVALAFVVPSAAGANIRLEHALGPLVTFVVLPCFGLFNAGLALDGVGASAFGNPLVLGIAAGLLLGKPIGVFGATVGAARLGLARLPAGLSLPVLAGGAILCGIGFTMSLFIGGLAFGDGAAGADVKLAVFAASVLSALAGIAVLAVATAGGARRKEAKPGDRGPRSPAGTDRDPAARRGMGEGRAG